VKALVFGVAAVLLAGAVFAGERNSGVLIFTAPDGSRHVINVPAAGSFAGSVPDGIEGRRQQLWPVVRDAAQARGIDPHLVDLVIRMESGYNPRAVSRRGARGVMQLMPETASLYGVRNSFDPLQNIRGGVRYLGDLLERFHSNLALALAAYNAGPDAVERHGGVPPYDETQAYVQTILAAYSGGAGAGALSGGFGRPARHVRPVVLVGAIGTPLISNSLRRGEATIDRPLALR
jgi:soluble lytic murein transglycosylase-like protein